MSSISELQEQLDMYHELLATTNEFLQHVPDDADTLQSKADTEREIEQLQGKLAKLKKTSGAIDEPPPPPPTSFARPPPPPPAPSTASFSVGDHIQAKYSEDGSFYAAVIVSKTGNPSDPLYTVKFTGYGNTETKKAVDLKAVDTSKKRKADDAPSSAPAYKVPPPPPPPPSDSTVISAAPAVDKTLVKKYVPSLVSDGPTRLPREPKKLKSNKALDKAKNNWQAFQKTGPKVSGSMTAPKQKESQFRVGTAPGSKVGFTGSGKGMQKDSARVKWKPNAIDDGD